MSNLNLNLLPRKPFFKRMFRPILSSVVVLAIVPFSVMLVNYISDSISESSLKAEISDMDNRVQGMSKRLQSNQKYVGYEEMKKVADQLELSRTDWNFFINRLEVHLPSGARYTSLSSQGNQGFQISFVFESMSDVITYIARLEKEPGIEGVKLSSITKSGEPVTEGNFELTSNHTVNIDVFFHHKSR